MCQGEGGGDSHEDGAAKGGYVHDEKKVEFEHMFQGQWVGSRATVVGATG